MSDLETLIQKHQNRVGPSFLVFLAWLSSCDGDIDENERSIIAEAAKSFLHIGEHMSAFFRIANKRDCSELSVACKNLREYVRPEHRSALFELGVVLAMADGVFSVGENHLVRLLADVLVRSEEEMNRGFRNVTGGRLPSPSDLGSAEWWAGADERSDAAERERGDRSQERKAQGDSRNFADRSRPRKTSKRSDSLRLLGLDDSASDDEIRAAFKRLAKVHHPDRFHGLDDEIVRAANTSFQKFREAYEYLIK